MDKSVTDFNVRLRTIQIRDLIVGIIITVILSGIAVAIFPEIYESNELFFIVFFLIGAILFIWALRGTRGLDRNIENLFEDSNKKEILYVFLINLLFASLFMLLISTADIISGFNDPNWISMWDIETINVDAGVIILEAIGSIIFAPIVEELVFRGVLFNRLKIRTGIIPAMLISSFLFAIGHDFGGMTSAFMFGICMCILYLKTDNILIPMSVHFINNLVATILETTQIDIFLAQFPLVIPSLIISIIGSVLLIIYIIKEAKKLKNEYI
ncbi:MAG: type II CAAX endopeptidase family protein [Methanobrevibacter sp.]|nr:type II CAAX endopeptidase family protein [Methanobrevibacter sp.]